MSIKTIVSEAVTGVFDAHFTVKAVVTDTKTCVSEAVLRAAEEVARAQQEAIKCTASSQKVE